MLFPASVGERLSSSVRKVELATGDPLFAQVGRLQRELRSTHGEPFFYGWALKQKATEQESRDAALFLLRVVAVFEPAGEEVGTTYDESSACPMCGSGATNESWNRPFR
jgi:hypothetical protein